nr:CatA-like O-acetyltransferase [Campylobacter blaseri]
MDMEKWDRKEYFKHYFSNISCTYSLTTKLDITKIKNSNEEFCPKILHLIFQVVNRYDEFKTSLDNDGRVGIFTKINPSYTIFHKDSKTFSCVWTEYFEDYERFYKEYLSHKKSFWHIKKIGTKPNTPKNVYSVSVIPWESFDGLSLNLEKG